MLAHRIISTLLIKGTSLYKGKRFNAWRQTGHALQAVLTHQARGVDELIVLDVGKMPMGPNFAMIAELTKECFSPITVGGRIRNVEDVRRLLEAGADKVSICTAAFDPHLINDCAGRFGSQAIVVALDVDAESNVRTNCGLQVFIPPVSAVSAAQEMEKRGAGEILLTAIDREGTMKGYDLDLIHAVSHAVTIPVIAHGGCSGPEDMYQAIQAGASAIAAGALFLFTENTPKSCAEYLASQHVEVRL